MTPEEFSHSLIDALKGRYNGRLPSAQRVADDLGDFSRGACAVSAEAVRKWMRGMTMPRGAALLMLQRWLRGRLDLGGGPGGVSPLEPAAGVDAAPCATSANSAQPAARKGQAKQGGGAWA